VLTGQECERSRRQQALHCGHSGKSGQRGRRVATGLRGYGACEAAEGVVQKSGAKDESSRSGTLTFNGTHASERGAAARKVEWGPALREFENFVGSRFTPACNTSLACYVSSRGARRGSNLDAAQPAPAVGWRASAESPRVTPYTLCMPGGDPLATCALPVGVVYLLTYL
jgi:hypothetical protein